MNTDDQRRALVKLLRATSDLAGSGDSTAAQTLWLAFEGIARSLATLTDLKKRRHLCNYQALEAVLMRVVHQLQTGLNLGEREALETTYGLTERGCQLLETTARNNPDFVAVFAERSAFWPVLMATKQMYHDAADQYLKKIRVGQKSIPPTTSKTKIEATDRWTKLATMLINDIILFRWLLVRANKGIKSTSPFEQKIENDLRRKARNFPGVLTLELPSNLGNSSAWWEEALPMLKYYWEKNPTEASKDWNEVGRGGGESGQTYAIRRVREAFKSLAKSTGKST
jgi:hypothetical protein